MFSPKHIVSTKNGSRKIVMTNKLSTYQYEVHSLKKEIAHIHEKINYYNKQKTLENIQELKKTILYLEELKKELEWINIYNHLY